MSIFLRIFCPCKRSDHWKPEVIDTTNEDTKRSIKNANKNENSIRNDTVNKNHESDTPTNQTQVQVEVIKNPDDNCSKPVKTEDESIDSSNEKAERRLTSEELKDIERRGGFRARKIDFNKEIPKHSKSKADEHIIETAISNNEFLCNIFKGVQLQAIVSAMYPREVSPGEILIKQGEDGDNLFVSAEGRYEIIINGELYNSFNDSRIFGELAILYNNKRLATIKAVTKGRVWILDGQAYLQITVKNALAEEKELLSFLRNVPAVNKANDQKLKQIINLLKQDFFQTNTEIVKQGDKGDKFYIIKAGTACVSIDGKGQVATLSRGQFFGERALLQEDCRQATVTADSPGVECLSLCRQDFIDYLGDLKAFIDKDEPDQTHTDNVIISNEYSDLKLTDLDLITTLGIGGFGRVELVQHKERPDFVFALKYLKKKNMAEERQHAFNEKNILLSCDSCFIIKLYKTFQNQKYLYYLMESCLGGDLWGLLQKQKGRCFDESKAKFLTGCVIEAIAHLHGRNIVYRDLKPENMLIDNFGYVKLIDFSFAKHLKNGEKTFTFVGTPEYVAPEIVYNRGHDKSVDYWALGIFIFELLVGKTPFRSNDPSFMKTYTLIIKGIDNVMFPSRIPKTAQQLIRKLCKSIASERLGNQRNGIDDIRNHKWFADFDWKKLRERKYSKVPYVPKLKNSTDTSAFDKFPKDEDIPSDVEDDIWNGF
ncbi:PREDICTED: cGMP-dependent protein kinase 1-like [Nicrophorus vespilloides]|uniref:cGMP-dependent protein kinase n=1 Tax=Nicrophorus vespilloides TaxID=110193 RepID=A0ABM1MER6_NICVS|nr:PREDICTED: cGMP-dependent protein kinase 1-like [Nicrophorus vespilloides]